MWVWKTYNNRTKSECVHKLQEYHVGERAFEKVKRISKGKNVRMTSMPRWCWQIHLTLDCWGLGFPIEEMLRKKDPWSSYIYSNCEYSLFDVYERPSAHLIFNTKLLKIFQCPSKWLVLNSESLRKNNANRIVRGKTTVWSYRKQIFCTKYCP